MKSKVIAQGNGMIPFLTERDRLKRELQKQFPSMQDVAAYRMLSRLLDCENDPKSIIDEFCNRRTATWSINDAKTMAKLLRVFGYKTPDIIKKALASRFSEESCDRALYEVGFSKEDIENLKGSKK